MRYLKCTKKVLDEIGIKTPATIEPRDNASEPLGDWCVNLLRIDRRKCLLFVNEKTLYSVIAIGLKKAHIQNIAIVFRDVFFGSLLDEGFSAEQSEKILAEYNEIALSKTTDRSVLASMNDVAFRYDIWILDEGGVENCNIRRIMMQANRMPMGARSYAYSVDLLKEACKTID